MKKLNIIVTCYNKEKYVSYVINMLKEQITEDVKLHIYDDGSTDNSINIINQVLQDYNKKNIITHFIPNNLGTGAIRELALQNVNSTYFIFVDADDLISENYVQKILYTYKISSKCSSIIGFLLKTLSIKSLSSIL